MGVIKLCPECGKQLLVRKNKETDQEFLGCSQFPECKHTEPLPTDMKLRLMGAAQLPGFED